MHLLRRVWPVLALLVASPVGTARLSADEPPAVGPSPAERASKVLAGLAAPSSAEAWSFEGEVLINGALVGAAEFHLGATQEGEAVLWQANESVRIGAPGQKPTMSIEFEALLDAALTGLHGRTVSTNADGTTTFTWRRTPLGYGLERVVGEQGAEKALLKEVTLLKASIGGLVRFCRALPVEPATYAVDVLNLDVNVGPLSENRAQACVLEVQGLKPFTLAGAEREVWLVRRKVAGTDESFLAFDPDDRSLLAITKPATRMEVRRKGLAAATAEPEAIDWKAPAKSAEVAALIAGRAFATADLEAIERGTWWPSATEALKDQPEFAGLDADGRKALLLASLKKSLKANPPEMIEFALQQARGDLVKEDAGQGRVRVKFPAMFRSLVLTVMEVEGTWYLAEFPSKSPPPAPPESTPGRSPIPAPPK